MNLKKLRVKFNLKQWQLARKVFNKDDDKRTAEILISYIERHKCLPTKETLKRLCEVLECDVLDIFDYNEIDLVSDINTQKTETISASIQGDVIKPNAIKRDNRGIYHLSVRLNREVLEVLNKSVLNSFGYADITDFINRCVKHLMKRYKKRVAQSAGTQMNDKSNSALTNPTITPILSSKK